jgi:hypothetical protein
MATSCHTPMDVVLLGMDLKVTLQILSPNKDISDQNTVSLATRIEGEPQLSIKSESVTEPQALLDTRLPLTSFTDKKFQCHACDVRGVAQDQVNASATVRLTMLRNNIINNSN